MIKDVHFKALDVMDTYIAQISHAFPLFLCRITLLHVL